VIKEILYIAPTLDNTGEVRETMVRKLAVNPTLLRILTPRNRAALGDGNSNVSRPVKCRIGSGNHMNNRVNSPIPVVQALENMTDRYGPIGETAQARALYRTSYNPYNTAPQAITCRQSYSMQGNTASPINRR
jgi:hypothetical protein